MSKSKVLERLLIGYYMIVGKGLSRSMQAKRDDYLTTLDQVEILNFDSRTRPARQRNNILIAIGV